MNKMKTYLVTGGAGFIGSNFVLVQRRCKEVRIVNFDLLTYAGNPMNLESLDGDQDHVFVRGDIGDRGLVKDLLEEYHPCAVVNFAAESHVDRSIDGPEDFIRTNVVGTFHLLEEVHRYWNGLQDEERKDFRLFHYHPHSQSGSGDGPDLCRHRGGDGSEPV